MSDTRSDGTTGKAGAASASLVVMPVLGLVVTVVVWWLVTSQWRLIHSASLASPQGVWTAFNTSRDRLLEQTWTTATETVVGFLMSMVAGVVIGLLLAASRTVERMFLPLLVAVNAVPKIALAPLLVVTLGWGQKPILTMVFLLCFFPIVVSTATGLTSTPADLAELARSLDASRWQAFRKVKLPAALPQIFVGLKVAMPLAAIGAVIGEFQVGVGLGNEITQALGFGDTATAWAAIILVALASIVLYYVLVLIERMALPWVRETTSAR